MAAAQAAENLGDKCDLTWWELYTAIATWNHLQNSAVEKAAILEISSHGRSLKWSWRPSQSARG